MKSRQKITRIQLDTETGKDFSLFGIVSAEPDYRLSLLINKALKISLRNEKPVSVVVDGGDELTFSRFSFHSGKNDIVWNLISNKSGKSFLISKLKKIDYLFQVYLNECKFDISGISMTLRTIEAVTAVFVLDPDELKDKNLHYLIP